MSEERSALCEKGCGTWVSVPGNLDANDDYHDCSTWTWLHPEVVNDG